MKTQKHLRYFYFLIFILYLRRFCKNSLGFLQIIQIAPMSVVQTNVHPAAATVHPGSPFPVSVATVMAPGAAPPQTVLLTSPPTRSLTEKCDSNCAAGYTDNLFFN